MVKKQWKGLVVTLLLLSFIVIVPATTSFNARAVHTRPTTCQGNGCDGQDPIATGCNASGSHLGTIRGTWENQSTYDHEQVWFSSACQSNYGFLRSENGRPLVLVAIFRADQAGKFCNNGGCTVDGHPCFGSTGCDFANGELSWNGGNARFYCSWGYTCYQTIPAGATTWETDLLYSPSQGPNQEVQVCQLAAGMARFSCSAWH